MSNINEDDRLTDPDRAVTAVVNAASRAGRECVIALLAKYDAKRASDLRVRDLAKFTRECEALPPSTDYRIGEVLARDAFLGGRFEDYGCVMRRKLAAEGFVIVMNPPSPPPAPKQVPPEHDYPMRYMIGDAMDDARRPRDCGASFSRDGSRLIEALAKKGLYISGRRDPV